MSDKHKIWDIIEYILGLIAFLSLLLFIHLRMSVELHDPDIWLHLKTGEYIVQHKAIPQIDIFSSTISGKEWIDHSWLVQVIFYLVFHFGGPDNLLLLSAITVILAFLFLFFSVYNQRQHLTLSVVMLTMAAFASQSRFNIRPENFSILFFSLYLFLLTRHVRKNWIFLLPLIQLIWVNCHGFFILGPLLVAIFILAEKLKRLGILPWQWNETELLDARSYRNLVRVFLLVCVASFINPYGYKGALYPFLVIFDSTGKTGIFYKHIQELKPAWQINHNLFLFYYVLAVISLLTFLLNFKRINIAYLIIWLILLGISVRINRNVIFFNFAAFLIIMDNLVKGLSVKKLNFIEGFFGKSIYILKYIVIVIIILRISETNSGILRSSYYIFEDNRVKSSLLGVAAEAYPDKAADFILKNELPGNIFNLFNHGSYFIYRLFPKKKVFIDGRTELYGGNFFSNYQKILNIDEHAISDLFKRYKINTVLLSGEISDIGNLSRYFFNKPDEWALVYFAEDAIIFLRATSQNKTLIDKLRIDLKKRQVLKADLNKIGMRNVFPEPYIKFAWMFYHLGLGEQAISQAKEALRILPSASDAYNIIGGVYTKQKLYEQALEALRLARIYEPNHIETLLGIGNLYMETAKFKDAVEIYKKLIQLTPYDPEGYYLLGQSYNQTNNLKLAIKLTRTALKINPFNANYYKELGDLLCKDKDFRGAIQIYKNAIDFGLDPDDFNKRLSSISEKTKTQK